MRYLNFLTVVFISIFALSVLANELPEARHISVTGTATLDVKPDQVLVHFQASALAPKAALAKERVDQQVRSLLNNLTKAGFGTKALERADLYTRAEYNFDKGKRTFMGIRATRDLRYLLTDLNKINLFLDSVLSSDVETIAQLEYGLQSPKQWQHKVRQVAVDDSMEKASALAQAYKAKLGKIYSVNYQNAYPRPLMMRAIKDEMAATTYQAKMIKMNDRVRAVFLLEP